jgi:hypothetical protein
MKSFSFTLAAIALTILISITSCADRTTPTADRVQNKQTEQMVAEATRQLGMPDITNFQEMRFLKKVYELCDQEDMICHAYLYNSFQGKIGQYLGKCIGYGIPYSLQFSNPEKVVHGDKQLGYDLAGFVNYPMKLPQPEPNGLFKPEGLSATWLMLIDPIMNEPRVVYVEPEIIVSPFKLH